MTTGARFCVALDGVAFHSMLLELAQHPALLELHVEALEGAVDRLIGLYSYVNQACGLPPKHILLHISTFGCRITETISSISTQ